MNKIELAQKYDFYIFWHFIELGLLGFESFPPLISRSDLFDYVVNQLEKSSKKTDDYVSIYCVIDEPEELIRVLCALSKQECCNLDVQKRKWKVLALIDLLEHLPRDYDQGILSLLEFWASASMCDFCPFEFPNRASFRDYLTKETFDKLIQGCHDWIASETKAIIAEESSRGDRSTGDGLREPGRKV